MKKKYLTSKEYCELYRISIPTLYRHIKNGTIEYKKLGNRLLLPIEEEVTIQLPTPPKEKSNIEVLLDSISPEILATFSSPPDFGSVKIEVTYHVGKPVKVECGKSIKKKF